MTVVLAIVAVVAVVVIALLFVGSEAFRLGHETPAAIFDLDEAVQEVGERLPEDAQARLTYDEVRQLILATLEHLRSKGLGAMPGEDLPRAMEVTTDVIVADDDAVAVVLGRVEAAGLEVSDDDAFLVIRALLGYLDHIGALGPRA